MTRAIRNIAIIAHVDHGKTTMVDRLLQCAGTFRDNQQVAERVMDSNDLERERGITILAKNCAVDYMGTHINIIDTPGHADFGGEVERVLSMVDGVLLLVDAVEGPMPQTRFVTRKALALGLKPIVVVNKIDRPGARPDWVINQTFDLFDKLGATEEQLDFPVIYASALNGYAGLTDDVEELKKIGDMRAVFDTVIKYVPVRDDDPDGPLQLQICSLDYSSYVGKIGVGRVHRGRIRPNMEVAIMNGPDDTPRRVKVNQILKFQGLDRQLVDEAEAGDIILVNGIEDLNILMIPKGSGSENMSKMKMFYPQHGIKAVKKFIVDSVVESGANPCPPGVIGVGLGGTSDLVMKLAKDAIARSVGQRNPDPMLAEMEEELEEAINATGRGPMGLGGDVSCLAVHIECAYTHITQNPVAVNTQCWPARRARAIIKPSGEVVYGY